MPMVFLEELKTKKNLLHISFGFHIVMFSVCCVSFLAFQFLLAYSLMGSFLPLEH